MRSRLNAQLVSDAAAGGLSSATLYQQCCLGIALMEGALDSSGYDVTIADGDILVDVPGTPCITIDPEDAAILAAQLLRAVADAVDDEFDYDDEDGAA